MQESFVVEGHLETLVEYLTRFGLSALGALAVFLVGRWVANRIRTALHQNLGRTGLDPTLMEGWRFRWGLLHQG